MSYLDCASSRRIFASFLSLLRSTPYIFSTQSFARKLYIFLPKLTTSINLFFRDGKPRPRADRNTMGEGEANCSVGTICRLAHTESGINECDACTSQADEPHDRIKMCAIIEVWTSEDHIQLVRKNAPVAQVVILSRSRSSAISDAIVQESVRIGKRKQTTLMNADTTMPISTPRL